MNYLLWQVIPQKGTEWEKKFQNILARYYMIYSYDSTKAFMAKPQALSQPKPNIFHIISA